MAALLLFRALIRYVCVQVLVMALRGFCLTLSLIFSPFPFPLFYLFNFFNIFLLLFCSSGRISHTEIFLLLFSIFLLLLSLSFELIYTCALCSFKPGSQMIFGRIPLLYYSQLVGGGGEFVRGAGLLIAVAVWWGRSLWW